MGNRVPNNATGQVRWTRAHVNGSVGVNAGGVVARAYRLQQHTTRKPTLVQTAIRYFMTLLPPRGYHLATSTGTQEELAGGGTVPRGYRPTSPSSGARRCLPKISATTCRERFSSTAALSVLFPLRFSHGKTYPEYQKRRSSNSTMYPPASSASVSVIG